MPLDIPTYQRSLSPTINEIELENELSAPPWSLDQEQCRLLFILTKKIGQVQTLSTSLNQKTFQKTPKAE